MLDGIVGGLITNIITAAVVALIAVVGGVLAVAKGLLVLLLGAIAFGVLVVPVMAFRDYKQGTLPRGINPGRVLVGSLLYFVVLLVLAVSAAQALFS